MLNQTNQPEVSPEHSNINRNPLNDHDYCSPNKRLTLRQQQSDKSINSNYNHLSDSSSSSSLSSSVDSSKELVIEQGSAHRDAAKLLAPKNTPSVSRSKLARSNALQDMDGGVSRVSDRSRRARQTTSVTDKSEWIMGDDQIDSVLSEHLDDDDPASRRYRAQKEQDPAFYTYSSSDYSTSDASSGQESEDNSEDDPDRLWCTCQKPHDGKFMISCDICKDWFHGVCVGVTKLMGDRFTKQGKEWFCSDCQEKLRSGILRSAIPKKIVKKEKKQKATPIPGKRGRGRPRKSESAAREGPTRVSLRTTRKSSSSLDPKYGVDVNRLQKNLAKSDARSESFQDFSDGVKLKKLIKERKKDFFFKRALQEQQRAARRSELGLGRQTLTANLSDSLDSLATSTSAPNMNNLPISIKSEHKRTSKPNIVLQINTKKDPSADESNANTRIVTAIVRSPKKSKHMESLDPVVNDLFTAEPIQINKKVKVQVNTSSANPAFSDAASSNGDTSIRKRTNSGSSYTKNDRSPTDNDNGEQTHHSHKKKRKDSESSTPNGSSNPSGSKHIAQKIKESLENRCKLMHDMEVSSDKIEKLAAEIEAELNECFKEGTSKYLNKFRSLVFNLRDIKNQGLVKNVLTGEIPPARLVRMSPDEMASHELAKWRERENKHSIELIKRDAQLAAQQVIVKKTHKGEEVISAPQINEPDDPTAEVANQEPPTTPTKLAVKESRSEGIKLTLTSPCSEAKSSTLKLKIVGISKVKNESIDSGNECHNDSVSAKDFVREHDSQDLESAIKLSPKQDDSESSSNSKSDKSQQDSKKSEQDAGQDQPKRFRVAIETKLDPANLSRLKEPLIKPIVQPSTSSDVDYNTLTKTPPFERSDSADDHDDEEAIFDPDNLPTSTTLDVDQSTNQSQAEPCWSGSINMPEVAKFSASAKPVSGNLDFMHDEIGPNLIVCGRIAPDQVQSYIKKLRSTTKNSILLIKLSPLTKDDEAPFNSFFDYLYSRNRYGVIQANPQILKDFYILPVHENSSIPEALKPTKDSNIERQDSNCLIGLLVRSKRPTSSTSNYTPTPIK